MYTNLNTTLTDRNQRLKAESFIQLFMFRQEGWKHYLAPSPYPLTIGEKPFRFRPGLTFTPFANPMACNAHCAFCSEELVRKGGHHPTAANLISDQQHWFSGLREILKEIAPLPKGFSLSGLEATADAAWLLRLLEVLGETEAECPWDEKVLYTNGSGLFTFPELIPALMESGFGRIELSRCHWEEETNQQIMRFNRNQPIWKNEGYSVMVRASLESLHIRNSCILTRAGVNDLKGVEAYLAFAESLGVKEVVFRELSRIGEAYTPSRFTSWIDSNRVPVGEIMESVLSGEEKQAEGWEYLYSTLGYYYYNEHYRWKGRMEVILETSSYPALMEANASGVIQKLVYHSNGNLCGDWDPESCIIGNYPHAD